MSRVITHATPAPEQAAPVVVLLVAPASRLLLILGAFGTAAEGRAWLQHRHHELTEAGIIGVPLQLRPPPTELTTRSTDQPICAAPASNAGEDYR
jgi:hypothetical protein